jgi:hypothetical protein
MDRRHQVVQLQVAKNIQNSVIDSYNITSLVIKINENLIDLAKPTLDKNIPERMKDEIREGQIVDNCSLSITGIGDLSDYKLCSICRKDDFLKEGVIENYMDAIKQGKMYCMVPLNFSLVVARNTLFDLFSSSKITRGGRQTKLRRHRRHHRSGTRLAHR